MTDDALKCDEVYLGDGLYASFDGWQIILRAPREAGDHYVALEPRVFQSLVDYEARIRNHLLIVEATLKAKAGK